MLPVTHNACQSCCTRTSALGCFLCKLCCLYCTAGWLYTVGKKMPSPRRLAREGNIHLSHHNLSPLTSNVSCMCLAHVAQTHLTYIYKCSQYAFGWVDTQHPNIAWRITRGSQGHKVPATTGSTARVMVTGNDAATRVTVSSVGLF